jgi:hypothetical protein
VQFVSTRARGWRGIFLPVERSDGSRLILVIGHAVVGAQARADERAVVRLLCPGLPVLLVELRAEDLRAAKPLQEAVQRRRRQPARLAVALSHGRNRQDVRHQTVVRRVAVLEDQRGALVVLARRHPVQVHELADARPARGVARRDGRPIGRGIRADLTILLVRLVQFLEFRLVPLPVKRTSGARDEDERESDRPAHKDAHVTPPARTSSRYSRISLCTSSASLASAPGWPPPD